MSADTQNMDCEGVVLLWGHRPGIGYCGYLQSKRPAGQPVVLFFDADCLRDREHAHSEDALHQGDIVRYQLQERQTFRRFEVSSFEDVRTFAKILLARELELTRLIYYRLSPITQHLLSKPSVDEEVLKQELARELNDLIKKTELARPELILPEMKPSQALLSLMELKPSWGESLMRLNSLFLRDTFPAHIKTDQESWRVWPWDIIGTGAKDTSMSAPSPAKSKIWMLEPENRTGSLVLSNEAMEIADFHYDDFPDESLIPDTHTPVSGYVIKTVEGLRAFDIWPQPDFDHDTSDIAHPFPRCLRQTSTRSATTDQSRRLQRTQLSKSTVGASWRSPEVVQQGGPKTASSQATAKIRASTQPKEAASELHRSGIRYDWGKHTLVLRNARGVDLSQSQIRVLEYMLAKCGGPGTSLRSTANYEEVALCYERGRIEGEQPDLTDEEVQAELRVRSAQWTVRAKKNAQQFARNFEKLMHRSGVAPQALIRYRRKIGKYELSTGWDLERIVIGRSEASRVRIIGDVENFSNQQDLPSKPKKSPLSRELGPDPQRYED